MPCRFFDIDSAAAEVNGRPHRTATHRRGLRIKLAGQKTAGTRVPGSFWTTPRPQSRSGFQSFVPGIDPLEGAERLEVNALQDQQGAQNVRRKTLSVSPIVHDQTVQLSLARTSS